MSETIDRLLSMSSVTSVSADSIAAPKKEKWAKTKFDNWEIYKESFLEQNGIPKDIVNRGKEIIDKIENLIGDGCDVNYSPTFTGFKNKYAKSRSKLFTILKFKKGYLEIEIPDKDNSLRERNVFPQNI